MALLPNIPTSFVPHPGGSASPARAPQDSTGVFGYIAYGVLGFSVLLALSVFGYGFLLKNSLASKDAELQRAQAAIDPATVEGFVELRNRLTHGESLLKKHIAFSNFFATIDQVLPATVRFTTLHLSSDASGAIRADGNGIARNFNALAAVSSAFAKDGRIKDAIFSKISVNRDNTVAFAFSAVLDPRLVNYAASVTGSPPSL